jgi:hypothetical protein
MESLQKSYKVKINKEAVAKLAPFPTVGGSPAQGSQVAPIKKLPPVSSN